MVTEVMKLEIPTLQEVLEDSGGNEYLLEELLCKFRLWLTQQIHLPQDISDQRLKFFIATTKFDFEKAKKNLDTLYTLHNLLPEIYGNLDPLSDDMKLADTLFQFIPLPKLTPEKYRVHIGRLIDYDDSKFDAEIGVRYVCVQKNIHRSLHIEKELNNVEKSISNLMTIEMRIEEDIVTNNVFIWDFVGMNIHHLMQYTPMLLKKFDSCMKAYGLRIKAIYLINTPRSVDIIIKAAKSILKAKLFNRIHIFTSEMESLYDVIPKSILPMEYGGEQPSMNTLTDMWRAKLVERRDWFLKEEKRNANKLIQKLNSIINPDNVFGMPGTFRQLQID